MERHSGAERDHYEIRCASVGDASGDLYRGCMQAANALDQLDSIVAEQLRALTEVGKVRYAKSPPDSLKQRRSLGVRTDTADFEIILWESGEVEFGYGTSSDPHEEHLDISSKSELEDLVARFLETARAWPI